MSALMVRVLRSAVFNIKALAVTGRDGQMFAGCFNGTVKSNMDQPSTPGSKKDAVEKAEVVSGEPRHPLLF